MKDAVVQCVPNFSEGRDARRVEAIVAAMRVEGVRLLDVAMDAAENRSMVTVAGEPSAVVESALRGVGKAAELIDLNVQEIAHPLIGAADGVSFAPISGIRLEQCVLLARQLGLEIWRRFAVPVYFYEAAAARPDRVNLDKLRGQKDGMRDLMRKDASRRPDLGGPVLHPSAGACAVGAHKIPVRYNLYFDSADVGLVRTIAREIRRASGGLKDIQAQGALAEGRALLSMYISDFESMPLSHVYKTVSDVAFRHKVAPVEGEVVGLIPEAACERDSEWMRLLIGFDPQTQILERRLAQPLSWPAGD